MDDIAISPAGTKPVSSELRFVAPQIPTLVREPPVGDGWLHEIKHDGYRTLLLVEDGGARALTRNGHDWSDRYAPICAAAVILPCQSALIDGELIVQDGDGRSDFAALRRAIDRDPHRLVFVAFDLLSLDGRDLRRLPLVERRAALRQIIVAAGAPFLFSEHCTGDGSALLAAAERMGLEGIVSKKVGSRYRGGPSKSWLKTKCMTESEFVLVGMERNEGGAPFALLAREEDGALAYCGSAFVTLPQPVRDEFWTRAEALKVDRPVLSDLRKGRRKASFVRPEMRVRARHLRGGDMLRHATLTAILE